MVQKTEQLKKLNEEKTILRQAQIRIENELEKKKQERFDKAAAIRKVSVTVSGLIICFHDLQ